MTNLFNKLNHTVALSTTIKATFIPFVVRPLLSGQACFFSTENNKTKRLTKVQRDNFSVPTHLSEILVGLLLGDLSASRTSITSNIVLWFEQGSVNEAYILHLYQLFKEFCNSAPKKSDRNPDFRTGKVYTRIRFQTMSFPCFNYYRDLFYVDGVKIVPLNIGELLTPEGLAYWAMDDGYKEKTGFILCTDSYTKEEVLLLVDVLKNKFDLNCTVRDYRTGRYRIYIKTNSMDKFRSLVTPHFRESMMYKLAV